MWCCEHRPLGLSDTLTDALDLHTGKWELGIFSCRSREPGDPSKHLSYRRGIQVGERRWGKGSRALKFREPHHLPRERNSKWGRAFPTESGIQMWIPEREEKLRGAGGGRSGVHDKLWVLPPPGHLSPFTPCHPETQAQATSPRAIAFSLISPIKQ